jgi:tRNA A58 N-methylase Trm61
MSEVIYRFSNFLFRKAYVFYLPLYVAYKALLDRDERKILRRLIHPGMTVIDVGANIGIYTCFFSNLVGNSGTVIAFEPSSDNFNRLLRSVSTRKNVTPVKAVVGNFTGQTNLYLSKD